MTSNKKQTILQALMGVRGNATPAVSFVNDLATRINDDAGNPASFLYQFATKVDSKIWDSWNLQLATNNAIDVANMEKTVQKLIGFLLDNDISLYDLSNNQALVDIGHVANFIYWLMVVGFEQNTNAFVNFRSFIGVQRFTKTSKGTDARNLGLRMIKISSQICKDMSYFLGPMKESVSKNKLDQYWSFVNNIELNDDFEDRMASSYYSAGSSSAYGSSSTDLKALLVPYADPYQNLFTTIPLFGLVEEDNLVKMNKDLDLLSGNQRGKAILEEAFFSGDNDLLSGVAKPISVNNILKKLEDTERRLRSAAGNYITSSNRGSLEIAELISELQSALAVSDKEGVKKGIEGLITQLSNLERQKPQLEAILNDFDTDFRKIARFLSQAGDLGNKGKEKEREDAGRAIKLQYLENHRKLFDLAMRMLLGHKLYLIDNKFSADSKVQLDQSSFNFVTQTASVVTGSEVMEPLMTLANEESMLSAASTTPPTIYDANTKKQIQSIMQSDANLRKYSLEDAIIDPVIEILSIYKEAFLFDGYNAEYTVINPMLFLYEITGEKKFEYEDLTLATILEKSREDLIFNRNPNQISLKGTCFARKLFEAYTLINALSGSLITDWLLVGPSVEPQLPTADRQEDPDLYDLQKDAFVLDMALKMKRIKLIKAKKDEIIEQKSKTEKIRKVIDLPGLFLGDLVSLPLDVFNDKYIKNWGESVKKGIVSDFATDGFKGKGYKSYFGSYILPMIATLPSLKRQVASFVTPSLTIANANIDIALKFMSIFKTAGYGSALVQHIENAIAKAPAAVKKFCKDLASGKKLDYAAIVTSNQSDPNTISYLRQAIAYTLLLKSLDYKLINFNRGETSEEFKEFRNPPVHVLKLNSFEKFLGIPDPEADAGTNLCTAFELFLSAVYNFEYMRVKDDPNSPFFEASPYLIAGLFEIGFSCKDEFVLQVENFFKEPKSDDTSKNHVMMLLVDGLPRDMTVPVGTPLGNPGVVSVEGNRSNHTMMSQDKFLSFGMVDLVKTIAETATAGIASTLKNRNPSMKFQNVRSLIQNSSQNKDRQEYEGCKTNDFCLHLFRHYYVAAQTNFTTCNNSIFETLRATRDHILFGSTDKSFISANNIIGSQVGSYAMNSIRGSILSYFATRMKAYYEDSSTNIGLSKAPSTYLSLDASKALLGTYNFETIEKTRKEQDPETKVTSEITVTYERRLESFQLPGGNPVNIFVGDTDITGSCMRPDGAGVDSCATSVSAQNNMVLSILYSDFTEVINTDGIEKTKVTKYQDCVGGGYLVPSIAVEDHAFVAKVAYQALSLYSSDTQTFDTTVLESMISKGLNHMSSVGKNAFAIVDSLEVPTVMLQTLTVNAGSSTDECLKEKKRFLSYEEWLYSLTVNISQKYYQILLGHSHHSDLSNMNLPNIPPNHAKDNCYFADPAYVSNSKYPFYTNSRRASTSLIKNPTNSKLTPVFLYSANVCQIDKSHLLPIDFKLAGPTAPSMSSNTYHITPRLDQRSHKFDSDIIEIDYDAASRYVEFSARQQALLGVSGDVYPLLKALGVEVTKAQALNCMCLLGMFSDYGLAVKLLPLMANGKLEAIDPSQKFNKVQDTAASKPSKKKAAKSNPAFDDYYDDEYSHRNHSRHTGRQNPYSFDFDDFFKNQGFGDFDDE